jgi:hypothetical protein
LQTLSASIEKASKIGLTQRRNLVWGKAFASEYPS